MLVLDIYLGTECIQGGIPLRDRLTLGRDPASTAVLADTSVSRRHATLCVSYAGGEPVVTLRDEGSTNGTYVNGKRIVEQVVDFEDSVLIGRYRLALRDTPGAFLPGVTDDDGLTIVFTGNPFDDHGQSSSRLQALHDLAQRLHELDIPAILEMACTTVRRCLSFDTFCVVLYDKDGPRVANSWNRSGPCPSSQIRVSQTIVEACVRDKQPVISGNVRGDRRFQAVDSIAIRRISSAMCVPLLGGDGILGVLYCSSEATNKAYSQSDLQFLMLVASGVAVALRHQRSLTQVEIERNKLGAVLQSLREAVLVCDDEYRVVLANAAATEVFRTAVLVGKCLREIFAAAGYSHDFDPMATLVHKSFYLQRKVEGVRSYKIERFRSYHATVSPLSGLESDRWRHIICLRDVTNVQRAEKMREVFAYQLAHKLNTPLTLVQSTATFLEEKLQALSVRLGEQFDPATQDLIAIGKRNLAEMNALIERFVQLIGTEVGKAGIEAHHEVVELPVLVSQALDFAAREIDRSGLIVLNRAAELEVRLVVNAEKVAECFLQIVQNAAKFAGRGATLTVEAKCDSSGLHVSFTDDGPGIPPEHHEEVFDIFHQIDVDDTGEVPGLGLGLWWTREVILVHGGDVVLTSPVAGGRGTRIDCVFPRAILVEPVEDTKVHKVEPRGKTTDPPTDLDLEPLDVSRL